MTDTSDTPAVPEPVAYRCTEIEPLLPPNYEPIVKFTTDRELAEMRARRAGEWATEPLYSEAQMQALADRLAECEGQLKHFGDLHEKEYRAALDRAQTAEAALQEALDRVEKAERERDRMAERSADYPAISARLHDMEKDRDALRKSCIEFRTALAEARKVIERMRVALHDAITRPMGVVPESAEEFYDQNHPSYERIYTNPRKTT